MAGLRCRDVIKLFDKQLRSPSWKLLICVCPRRRLFLRINSRPLWNPHHRLRQSENTFLSWDSYVELRELVRVPPNELRQALARQENPIGMMDEREARATAFAAQQASTLSDEMRGIVWEGLVGAPTG